MELDPGKINNIGNIQQMKKKKSKNGIVIHSTFWLY